MSDPAFYLPVSLRDRLRELSGSELKVWLAYRSHMNAEGLAWPGREKLRLETGLSEETISACRTSLARKGWLVPYGTQQTHKGLFGVPKFRPVIPDRDGKNPARKTTGTESGRDGETPPHRDGKNPPHRDGKNPAQRLTREDLPIKGNHHALGALKKEWVDAWLRIKEAMRGHVSPEGWEQWVRAARLVGMLDVGSRTMLIAVPANGAIVAAAHASRQLLCEVAMKTANYHTVLTTYPDEWQRSQVASRFPQLMEQGAESSECTSRATERSPA